MAAVIAGAGVAALLPLSKTWKWVCCALIAAHVVSTLLVLPYPLAYANEAWGGPRNTYKVLADSNVDWGQQLYQVKDWEDRHPGEECWFAYMVRPLVVQETYGIHCHVLPNGMSVNIGLPGSEAVPPVIHGAVLLSASELNGALWPSRELNPYRAFQTQKPDEEIDYGVLVYRGDFHTEAAAGTSRAFLAWSKLRAKQPQEALSLAEEGANMAPDNLYTQWALGDVAAAVGKKEEARAAYQAAIAAANKLDVGRRGDFVALVQQGLNKL